MPSPELELDHGEECARKLALLHDIKTAMGELMDIHNREMQALIAEDFMRVGDFRTLLQSARSRKSELIELYREHVTNHGC
jgi:hypothetical protein